MQIVEKNFRSLWQEWPCAYNPEPLADFIDLFMIGDGEELLEQVCLLKMECDSKKEFLQDLQTAGRLCAGVL